MKFQLLPIGARFEYEGKVYVKTGPVSASCEHGGQRMIPRYATLKPLDGSTPQTKPEAERKLGEAEVLAAFDMFYRECERLLGEQSRPELSAARTRFIEALK
jgi:hypothetical protein